MGKSKIDKEIKLYFEFDDMSVQSCNFNLEGDLILFCKVRNIRNDDMKLVCVYSIQAETKTTKCQNIYMVPKEVEVISITNFDRIWLRLKNRIYEWNRLDGRIIVSDNIPGVIIKFIMLLNLLKILTNNSFFF